MGSWAIFTSEGFAEDLDNACSLREAEEMLAASDWAANATSYVDVCCEEHGDQPASHCEECEDNCHQ